MQYIIYMSYKDALRCVGFMFHLRRGSVMQPNNFLSINSSPFVQMCKSKCISAIRIILLFFNFFIFVNVCISLLKFLNDHTMGCAVVGN